MDQVWEFGSSDMTGGRGSAVVLTPNYGAEWVHRLRVKKRTPSNPNRNEQGDTSPSLRIPQALLSFPKFDTSLAAPPTAFLLSKCGPSRRTYWVWGRQSALHWGMNSYKGAGLRGKRLGYRMFRGHLCKTIQTMFYYNECLHTDMFQGFMALLKHRTVLQH